MQIAIRASKDTDMPFVYSTFLRGVYFGIPYFRQCDKVAFYKNYSAYLDALLPKCAVKVACLADDPDVILGYVVLQGSALHWAFTKQVWRSQGIFKQLLAGQTVKECTHLTNVGSKIASNKQISFNPFSKGD
ncbi:MAG: hypothetical protein NVS1B10_08880 [Candidatus Saccharimonadales bacterium]